MKRILIVEDEPELQELLCAYLQDAGYAAAVAGDGAAALDLFRAQSFDLVLLDIMLPKIDGFGVCAQIRRQSQVPILMLTALDGETQQLRGFYTVLFGPFLKVDIMQQAAHGPKIGFFAVAQVVGKPAHYRLHSQCVLDVKGLLIVLPQQGQGRFAGDHFFHFSSSFR